MERNKNKHCAVFSGQDVKFDGEKFIGADLTAVFGGVKLDLRNAIIEEDTTINAICIFGGIDILVPENIKIDIKSTSIFGGVSNKRKHIENKQGHTIYVNAKCVFGGVDIK